MITRKTGKARIVLTAIVSIILILLLIDSLTCRPFIWAFKGLMDQVTIQGNVGQWQSRIDTVEDIGTETISVDGYPDVKAYLYAPDGKADGLPLIVYIHGGGWCTGSARSVSWYAKLLASNGYAVANIDYSLAPVYQYPASTVQLVTAVNYLYENADKYGYDAACIFIGGNSAGAHLSSQLGALFTDEDYAKAAGVETKVPADNIHGLLLYNGVYDLETAGECRFPFFHKLVWAYTGQKDYKNYERLDELSTVNYITENYPAVFITVGDADPLEPQTNEFIEKLRENEVDCDDLLWDDTGAGLWHDYIYEQDTEEAVKAYEETVTFLDSHL